MSVLDFIVFSEVMESTRGDSSGRMKKAYQEAYHEAYECGWEDGLDVYNSERDPGEEEEDW